MGELRIFILFLILSCVFVDGLQGEKYIELDHALRPKEISSIQIFDEGNNKCTRFWENSNNEQAKYVKDNSSVVVQDYVKQVLEKKTNEELENVLGTDAPNVYYDEDWGLFSSILASYNNHWALRTGPEDWWTVVLRKVAQAIADNGENQKVRELFVDFEGKKSIDIDVGSSLSNIDYNWLFDQFSAAIRSNIVVENYVDVIESDFSTTTKDQKIISQVMLMSSLKTYFSYGFYTSCGIPGVHMKGTEDDWNKLSNKLSELEAILDEVKKELGLTKWFESAKEVFDNLLSTYKGEPAMAEWWSRILSWKADYGSGSHPHWEGWFPKFLGATDYQPYSAEDFPSGLVYVTVNIADNNNGPPVKDKGIFIAGTLGFTVKQEGRAPIVEPNQIWNLLLPRGSLVTPRLQG